MGLQETLDSVHSLLYENSIDHALIGGLALAMLGIHRATFDVDLLIDGTHRQATQLAMTKAGWKLAMGTAEVLHFTGKGRVDFILANRPLTLEMLQSAKTMDRGIKCVSAEGIIGLKIQAYKNNSDREFQDKADIQSLIKMRKDLDWIKIKTYADIFEEWPFIESLRNKQ